LRHDDQTTSCNAFEYPVDVGFRKQSEHMIGSLACPRPASRSDGGIWLLIAPNTWNYASIIMTWNNVLVGLAVLIFGVWRVGELNEGGLQWRTPDEHDDRRRAAARAPKLRKKRVRR
jgi:hypothetical protein